MDGEFKIAGEGKTIECGTKAERFNLFNKVYTQATVLETIHSMYKEVEQIENLEVYADEEDMFNNACAFLMSFLNSLDMYVTISTAMVKARFAGDDEATVLTVIESQLSLNPKLCKVLMAFSDVTGDGELSAIIRDYVRRHPEDESEKDDNDKRFEEMLAALIGSMKRD